MTCVYSRNNGYSAGSIMVIDRPIGVTPNPPPFAEETEQTAQNVVDIQVAEANPNIEMMDDGSALIGDQPDMLANTCDMN